MKFKENPEDHFDTQARIEALEKLDKNLSDKMKEGGRLGVPSADESLVQNYIRNRIKVPEDLTDESKFRIVSEETKEESLYTSELAKLKNMDRIDLKKLLEGCKSRSQEDKNLFSMGDLLKGFEIDPETLEYIESADHSSVLNRIKLIDRINSNREDPIEDNEKRRFVSGMVYHDVKGFTTPILMLIPGMAKIGNIVPKETKEKVIRYLKSKKKYLPLFY